MTDKHHSDSSQTSIRIPHPAGLFRLVMRLPILAYRLRLGWLLGKRFLLLEHRGRKSGITRRTVIEVVDHDPQVGSFVAAAAWGNQSDWYKNISAHPQVTVQVGSRKFSAIAATLPQEEAIRHLAVYARNHPLAFRELASILIGPPSGQTEQTVTSLAESVPLVQFIPLE